MNVCEVKSAEEIVLFHRLVHLIYAEDEKYIYSLEDDIEFVFDSKKNSAFRSGDAKRWVILDQEKNPIGRVAGFYSQERQGEDRFGGFGFLEMKDDPEVSKTLLDLVALWLEENKVSRMIGPMSFGERDKFWGLLENGETSPSYLQNHHPAYYKTHLEGYGLQRFKNQYSYQIDRVAFDARRFTKIAKWISRKPGFRFEAFDDKKPAKHIRDFVQVYNELWRGRARFHPIDEEIVQRNLRAMDGFLQPEFIWFAYRQDKPIGVLVMFPDLNELAQHIDGTPSSLNRMHFWYLRKFKTITKIRGLILGVLPSFRGFGITAVLIYRFYKAIENSTFQKVEFTWADGLNEQMAVLMKSLGVRQTKEYGLYEKEVANSKNNSEK